MLFDGAKVNAVKVAVNWRLTPVEMEHTINDAEVKALFVGGDFPGPARGDRERAAHREEDRRPGRRVPAQWDRREDIHEPQETMPTDWTAGVVVSLVVRR